MLSPIQTLTVVFSTAAEAGVLIPAGAQVLYGLGGSPHVPEWSMVLTPSWGQQHPAGWQASHGWQLWAGLHIAFWSQK